MILEKKLIEEIIKESSLTGADFVEVFAEDTIDRGLSYIGGKVERIGESRTRGVGLRIALGYNYVYGYTNDISRDSLLKLARDLRASFNEKPKTITPLKELVKGTKHRAKIKLSEVPNELRIEKVVEAYDAAKAYDKEIDQVATHLTEEEQTVLIANMDGRFVEDTRSSLRLSCSAIAKRGQEMENGFDSCGRSMGFEMFDEICDPKKVGIEAARIAMTNLNASDCPSGEMPVIIENGFGGVIFHEAVGHSLEATSVARGASVFCNMLGKRVAQDCVSAVDDGTLENEWGSNSFDDEGYPQKRRVLIENGILKSYMVDEINGRKMNAEPTCSSRRESYKYAPTSRMSNTYILPGKSTLEEMLSGIKLGLYTKKMGGGSVNPATGDFNFAANEAYLIRDGKICEAVKGASLVGNGRDVLMNIDMVSNNLLLGQGVCGSASGRVNTNVGQPAIRVSKITVGGRKA